MSIPGQHMVLVARSPLECFRGRFQSWELRDTLLILLPGPSTLFAVLFRVQLNESTVAAQVLKTGTGAINIDACRVGYASSEDKSANQSRPSKQKSIENMADFPHHRNWGEWEGGKGRWPSNLLLVHAPGCQHEGEKRVKASVASKSFHVAYEGTSTTTFLRGWSHPGNQHVGVRK